MYETYQVDGPHVQAAKAFVEAMAAGQPGAMAQLLAPGFRWMGRSMSGEDLGQPRFREFLAEKPWSVGFLREVPTQVMDLLQEDRRNAAVAGYGGASDRVVLIDVTRGAKTFTVGVLVGFESQAAVREIFDPVPLADELRQLKAA